MKSYDYRIDTNKVNEATQAIESLSNRQLIRLADLALNINEEDEARRENGKIYFSTAILPCLEKFAETAEAFLTVDEYDNGHTFLVMINHPKTITILQNSPFVQILFLMAKSIEVSVDEGISLMLTYSF